MAETLHGGETRELDLAIDFNDILKAGYTINLWNTGGSVRVAEILNPGDSMGGKAPKLGYGADGTAAEALVRARDSFAKRVDDRKEKMTPEDIRASDAGYMTGAYPDGTYLDAVACVSEITFYQAGDEVVARIPSLRGQVHGHGDTMLSALENLEAIMQGRTY